MKRTWKPMVAGILDLIIAIPAFVGYLCIGIVGLLENNLGAVAGFFLAAPAIAPLIGGICALRRRIWWLALAGSVLPLILRSLIGGVWWTGWPIRSLYYYTNYLYLGNILNFLVLALVIMPIILIALSKKEFGRPPKSTE